MSNCIINCDPFYKKSSLLGLLFLIVRKKGLEPPRREAPDPKSGAATNYATSAVRIFKSGKDNYLNGFRRLFFRFRLFSLSINCLKYPGACNKRLPYHEKISPLTN